jgi:hypothetical protein
LGFSSHEVTQSDLGHLDRKIAKEAYIIKFPLRIILKNDVNYKIAWLAGAEAALSIACRRPQQQ